MTAWTLAIDFGTSYTVAAARVGDRSPEIVEISGERRMPSVVMVDPEGEIFVGRTAEDLSVSSPGSTLRALKNRLGDQTPAILGGRPHQVVLLVAALLREVYDQVVEQMGEPPAEVRLTHPATWNQPRINRLVEAAAKAGLPNPLLVPEPVAAALSYAADVGIDPGRPIVVYDLGGGTFDSAVVTARNGGFTVVGRPGGDQHIGGELFDELVVNHIGAMLDADAWEAIQVGDDPLWRQVGAALRNEARKAKEALSAHPHVNVLIPLPDGLSQVRITRDEFREMVRPYIAETIETLRRCVAEAGVRPDELAGISLVGGSSRSPIVEEMVREAFPMVPISRRGDPKATVAAGATLADRPSASSPGLWRSPVTKEASPGTAQQRVRLAPPPLSDPPAAVPSIPPAATASPSPESPPVVPPPVVQPSASPPPVPPPHSLPPSPPGVVVGGQLIPEPAGRMSRKAVRGTIALLVVAAAAIVVVLVTRSDDKSSGDAGAASAAATAGSVPNVLSTDTDSTDSASTDTESPTESTNSESTEESTDTESTSTESTDASSTSDGGGDSSATGHELGTLSGHKGEVTSLSFSPNGRWLLTAGADGVAIVWNVASGKIVAVLSGHTAQINSAVFSPDGKSVATASNDGTIRVWDAATGNQSMGFTGHTGPVHEVRFNPDGGSLVSASSDGTVKVWDIGSQTEVATYSGATAGLNFAEFSPNGQQILAGSDDGNTLLWNISAPNDPLYLTGEIGAVRAGAFSPDGTLVMSGGDDARIRVWSAETGEQVLDVGNIEGGVRGATFSHDGTLLMANGNDQTAALWEVATGQLLGDLAGHTDAVVTAVFSPDDDRVVTASADGTAKIWRVTRGAPPAVELATLDNGAATLGAVFSPDGTLVVTANSAGDALVWAG